MFVDVLDKRYPTYVKGPTTAFWHLLRRRVRGREACVIVYYDVLAPFVAILRFLFPALSVVYMVRGDQVSWARFQGRLVRAKVAELHQKWMLRLGCVFVFASEDLRLAVSRRLGLLHRAAVLPNTLGRRLPPSRPFDGRIAVVGDFDTVKNIEFVLNSLCQGEYQVDLFGNTRLPDQWRQPWLHSHGVVSDLPSQLKHCSLIVLSSISEGFPNLILEALEAGCCIVAPSGPPFKELPLSPLWRYQMQPRHRMDGCLTDILHRLLLEQRDFRADNRELYDLIESDWEDRIWEIFA